MLSTNQPTHNLTITDNSVGNCYLQCKSKVMKNKPCGDTTNILFGLQVDLTDFVPNQCLNTYMYLAFLGNEKFCQNLRCLEFIKLFFPSFHNSIRKLIKHCSFRFAMS